MKNRTINGKWQKRVQKALLKRDLQQMKKTNGNAAAKTAEQQENPTHSIKKG